MAASFCTITGDYFNKSHDVFRKSNEQLAKNKEILNLYLPSTVRKILQHGTQRHHFNVLSVGSGEGEMDQHIVNIIKKELQSHEKYQHMKIFTRAIEPNGHSVSQYKAMIERSPNDDQTTFDVSKKTFEEYKQERMSKKSNENYVRFDVVHFIHSIYFFDLEETLNFCFEKELQENGQVVCVVSDFIDKNFISKLSANTVPFKSFAERIIKIAEKRGWQVDRYVQEISVDFTEVFDENSSEGNMLLDFLTQTRNFRSTAEKKKVEEILQVIEDLSIVKDGKRLGKKVDDVLFIYK